MCKCFSLESNLYQHYVGKITNMEIYFPSQASSPRAPPLHSIKHGGTNLLISSRHFIRFAILCRSPFLAIFVFSRRGVGILLLATDRHHLRLQIGIILLLRQGSRCCCSSHAPTLVLPSMHTLRSFFFHLSTHHRHRKCDDCGAIYKISIQSKNKTFT